MHVEWIMLHRAAMRTQEALVVLVGGLGWALACGATDQNTDSNAGSVETATATSGGSSSTDAGTTTDGGASGGSGGSTSGSTSAAGSAGRAGASNTGTTTGAGGSWNCDGSSSTGSGSEGEYCEYVWGCDEGNIGLRCGRYSLFNLGCTCVTNENTFIVHDSLDCAVMDLDVVEEQCDLEVADGDDDVLPDVVITPGDVETAFDLAPMDPADCGAPVTEAIQTGCTWNAECSATVALDCWDPQNSSAACRCVIGDQYYRPFSVTEPPLDCSAWTAEDVFEQCGIPTPAE